MNCREDHGMGCAKRSCDTEVAVSLPDDVLVEILSHVPFKSICRFKCVSKAWRDLITDPQNSRRLPQALNLEEVLLAANLSVDFSDSEDKDDKDSDMDDEYGEDSGSYGGGEDSDMDDGYSEDSGGYGGGENSDMDDEYGEDSGSYGGGENYMGAEYGEDSSS